MNNLIINNTSLEAKEYNGQKVLTFKDIDRVHNRPEGTARRNFNDNKNKFVENEDYFFLKPDNSSMYEKRTLEIPPKGITLLTQTGYLMLAKSLTDDLAWKVQRLLVNKYFNSRKEPEQVKLLEPIYEYKEKYYNGEVVVTLRDLEHFTKISYYTFRHCIKEYSQKFEYGKDYWLLMGEELLRFKNENDCFKGVKSLIVISKSGFIKLARLLRGVPKEIECFKGETREIPVYNIKWGTRTVVDIPENPEFLKAFKDIRKCLNAIDVSIDSMNCYTTEDDVAVIEKAMNRLVQVLGHRVMMLEYTKYNMIEKVY